MHWLNQVFYFPHMEAGYPSIPFLVEDMVKSGLTGAAIGASFAYIDVVVAEFRLKQVDYTTNATKHLLLASKVEDAEKTIISNTMRWVVIGAMTSIGSFVNCNNGAVSAFVLSVILTYKK